MIWSMRADPRPLRTVSSRPAWIYPHSLTPATSLNAERPVMPRTVHGVETGDPAR